MRREKREDTALKLIINTVIGNPPYNGGLDIAFTYKSLDIVSDFIAVIIPAKWQSAEGIQRINNSDLTYGQFRDKTRHKIKEVVFYPCCHDIFDISQIDGITYILIDKQNIHETSKIINKSTGFKEFNSIETRDISNGQPLLNIGNSIINSIKQNRADNKPFVFPVITHTKHYEIWMNTKLSGYDMLITDKPRYILGISRLIDRQAGQIYSGEAKCVFESDDLDECKSFASWIYSKFTRFFILCNISKLNNILTDFYFRYVPAPPSGKFDHIYTDEELYSAFGLKQEQIEAINSLVRERPWDSGKSRSITY